MFTPLNTTEALNTIGYATDEKSVIKCTEETTASN